MKRQTNLRLLTKGRTTMVKNMGHLLQNVRVKLHSGFFVDEQHTLPKTLTYLGKTFISTDVEKCGESHQGTSYTSRMDSCSLCDVEDISGNRIHLPPPMPCSTPSSNRLDEEENIPSMCRCSLRHSHERETWREVNDSLDVKELSAFLSGRTKDKWRLGEVGRRRLVRQTRHEPEKVHSRSVPLESGRNEMTTLDLNLMM